MEESEFKLVYVNPIGVNSNEEREYEFFFSETPDIVWGEDWNIQCASACENLLPDENTYTLIKRLKTKMDIFCVQQNSCYSMQDCIDGCVCLCYFFDEINEKYIPLQFGVDKKEVDKIFFEHNLNFLN